MSGNAPDNIVYLRRIDERLERLEREFGRRFGALEARFVALESRMTAIEARQTAIEEWSLDTTRRLGRIERRLELVDTPAP
jgi:hypothetical protein